MTRGGIIVDTQLLVLFLVGKTRRAYIRKHKRLDKYTEDDFDLLCEVLSGFARVIVTPNTLSEASSLVRLIGDPIRSEIYAAFGVMAATDEIYVASRIAAAEPEFPRLGLTDAVLLSDDLGAYPLVTADLDLYLAASKRGRNALNFHHLRDNRWQAQR
jgi:hypothetical protein